MGAEQSTLGYVPACSVAEEAARDARRLVVLDGRGAVHLQQCVLRDNEPGAGLDAVPCGQQQCCAFPVVEAEVQHARHPEYMCSGQQLPPVQPTGWRCEEETQTCNECPAYYPWLNDVRGQ